jgi:two-component sensor histidine kinase
MLANAEQDSLDPVQLTSAIIHGALNAAPIQCRFDVAVEAPEDLARISARQAVTLALIVNELTTNSVKYAFADRTEGEIRAHLEQQAPEAKLRLVFRDDGPGWPDEVLAGERHSMGMWLIQTSVTNNLQGDIVWHNDGGAVVEIQFPVQPLNKQ